CKTQSSFEKALGSRQRKVAAATAREAAEDAVRTLIRWSGGDPDREGLVGTPARVVRAYEEWFAGYFEDPREYLNRWAGTTKSCCCEISDLNPTASTTWRRSLDAFTLAICPGIGWLEYRSLRASSMSTQNVFKFKKK